jgi:hypothetical protein
MPYAPSGSMIATIPVIFVIMKRSVPFNSSLINRLMQCHFSFRYIQLTPTTAVLYKIIKCYSSTYIRSYNSIFVTLLLSNDEKYILTALIRIPYATTELYKCLKIARRESLSSSSSTAEN